MIKTFAFTVATCLASLVCELSLANAEVLVYDNGVDGPIQLDDSILSDLNSPIQQADDFQLAAPQTITRVEWTGTYGLTGDPPLVDNITIEIYDDDGGVPFANATETFDVGNEVNRVDSGYDLLIYDIFLYSAAIDFTPTENRTYWISIFGDTTGDESDFYWGAIYDRGNSYQMSAQNPFWSPARNQQDFRLFTVPEPTSLLCYFVILSTFFPKRDPERAC